MAMSFVLGAVIDIQLVLIYAFSRTKHMSDGAPEFQMMEDGPQNAIFEVFIRFHPHILCSPSLRRPAVGEKEGQPP